MYCYISIPFFFNILCSGHVVTGVLQAAVVLCFEVSGNHFEECYVITVLWYVTKLTYVYLSELRSNFKYCL